jgi:hypothetical protein
MYNASPESPAFIQRQFAFANHIRQPDQQPKPVDVESWRMAIYNELFYNNVEGFLADNFPVLRQITPDERWHAMIRDFFARHPCSTPLFSRLPEEFLDYLHSERGVLAEDPPYLYELAHYEWVELALTLSDADQELSPIDRAGDVLSGQPLLSPLAWPLSYDYAVHRIRPDYLPDQPEPGGAHLLVYRDRQDRIGFLETNPVIQALLALLQNDPTITGKQAVGQIVAGLVHPDPASVMTAGCSLLNDLRQREIILGTRITNNHQGETTC